MTDRIHFARDVYPAWRKSVQSAQEGIRVFTPYFDALAVRLLQAASLPMTSVSVVTDLSPSSGSLDYGKQLKAILVLLDAGVEVRSLERLHAKVLQVDGRVTVGSQNFTTYARRSRETTLVETVIAHSPRFASTLDRWFEEAIPIPREFVEELISELTGQITAVRAANSELMERYDELAELERLRRAKPVPPKLPPLGIQLGRALTTYRTRRARPEVWAHLKQASWSSKLSLFADSSSDLTRWSGSEADGRAQVTALMRLKMYPLILNPSGQMGFARIAETRISYVRDTVDWNGIQLVAKASYKMLVEFPHTDLETSNMHVTLRPLHDQSKGVRLKLRFDGVTLELVDHDALGSGPLRQLIEGQWFVKTTEELVADLAHPDALREIAHRALAPFKFKELGIGNRNAEDFFPAGWLRVTLLDKDKRQVFVVSERPN